MKFQRAAWLAVLAPALLFGQQPSKPAEKKIVLEEIVARVNNEIITLTEYENARAAVRSEAQQDCPGCPANQIDSMVADREKNLLRDLIDNSLLVQRAKDLGFNVETEVIKQMDAIRQRQNPPLKDLEELCQAVEASGISCEDWKANIRNSFLTQEVIRREVGRTVQFEKEEIQKYYDEHKSEFVRPEQVYLFEIFVTTDGMPEEKIAEQKKKAEGLLDRVKNKGEDFELIAKSFSDGSTAQRGGELGMFEKGQLSKELEEVAFKMRRNDVSDVIQTSSGFLILKCAEHYVEGQQPLEKVEGEIMNRLYQTKVQPALRVYLTKLREESYVLVKPGFEDTAHVASQPIVEVEQPSNVDKDEKDSKDGKKDKKKDKKSGE